jgi:serine/threonine-protein kinase RsbT
MTGAGCVAQMPIRTGADVVRVRQLVRGHAQAVRLSLVDQTKLVTAASELARNIVTYGGSVWCGWRR